jgi:hypothetical protein
MITSTKQDWLSDLITEIPLDTMDYDFLVTTVLPRLRAREIKALIDAIQLARRDGIPALKDPAVREVRS